MIPKPSNLTPQESAYWDRIVAAANGQGIWPSGVGPGTPGTIYWVRVLMVLAAAANQGLDPVGFANEDVNGAQSVVSPAFYMLLIAALQAAGFGVGINTFNTVTPGGMSFATAEQTLNAMAPQTSITLTLPASVVEKLLEAIQGSKRG